MAVINPYANINWSNVQRILSVSHQHLSHSQKNITTNEGLEKTPAQQSFDDIYNSGVRHFALSRYRPSIISYPFDYTNNTFIYMRNPFKATEELSELKEKYNVQIKIEDDVIGSPNAEHINPIIKLNNEAYGWTCTHINTIGSTYETGLIPDPEHNGYKNSGINMPYSDFIINALNNLQYQDAGGIIINHPLWTKNELITKRTLEHQHDVKRFIMDCLDFDERVLGTDIIEDGKQISYQTYNKTLIDEILTTGRRCWIFCQSDWALKKGRNELLIMPPENATRVEKEYFCLKAYRDGAFFGRIGNSNLTIKSVTYNENEREFSIKTENADGIEVTIDGESINYGGNTATVTVPPTAKYVRAMAYTNINESSEWTYEDGDIYKDIVFTNPIMINPVKYQYNPAYDFNSEDSTEPDPTEEQEEESIPKQEKKNKFKIWLMG